MQNLSGSVDQEFTVPGDSPEQLYKIFKTGRNLLKILFQTDVVSHGTRTERKRKLRHDIRFRAMNTGRTVGFRHFHDSAPKILILLSTSIPVTISCNPEKSSEGFMRRRSRRGVSPDILSREFRNIHRTNGKNKYDFRIRAAPQSH